MSFNVLYTDEAISEIDTFLKSKACYIGPDGQFTANINTDTIKYIMYNLTS